MIILTWILVAIAALLLLPAVSDAISVLRLPFVRKRRVASTEQPRLLFLVPAHNEQLLIEGTVRSLLALRYPAALRHIVVVADNCTDDTAAVVRALGVECFDRVDAVNRGKPYALQWALSRLPIENFDAVAIIDADATVDPEYAAALATAAPLRDKAIMTYNDVRNREENALTRMASVFSAARVCMNELKSRVGVNSPMSNGLCLGTGLLGRHGWQAFSICEDWELYAILTARGEHIESVAAARVSAQEARSLVQSSSQRQRWAAGKITVLRRYALAIVRGPATPHAKLDAIAELLSLGPAVHFGLVVLLGAAAWMLAIPAWPSVVTLLALSLARTGTFTLLGIIADPQPGRASLAFLYLPIYTVWRLGVQIRALGMIGNKPWIRTTRHFGGVVELSTPAKPAAE